MEKQYNIKVIHKIRIYVTIGYFLFVILFGVVFTGISIFQNNTNLILMLSGPITVLLGIWGTVFFIKWPTVIITKDNSSIIFKNSFQSKEVLYSEIKSIKTFFFTNSTLRFETTKGNIITHTESEGFFDLIKEIKQKNSSIITKGF
jgi:hypothetical protein